MTPSQPLPDAAPANWVDRHAPAAWRPWLKLGRFDRPTGIWLLMLPGWQGIALYSAEQGAWPPLRLLALFALGAALMRAAGCAFNDIVDKDFDARVARTADRPVASGRIGVRAAWAFVIACSLGGLAILLTLNLMSLFLGVCSLTLVAAYPFMKRITWWPQAWLGLTFNWGVLLGYAAAQTGPPGISILTLAIHAWSDGVNLALYTPPLPASAWLLYASLVLWTLGYYLASVAAAVAAWREAGLTWGFLPLAAVYAGQLVWQALKLRVGDPAGALRLFKSNTLAGVLLLAAIVAGGQLAR